LNGRKRNGVLIPPGDPNGHGYLPSVSFNPASFSGFFSYVDIAAARAAGNLWQDAGKTIPAVANTDPVHVITDALGGFDYVAIGTTTRALLTTSAGLWYLNYDGSNDGYTFSGPACKPLSVHVAGRIASFGGTSVFICGPNGAQKFKTPDGGTTKPQGGKEGAYNWNAANTSLTLNTEFVSGLDYANSGASNYYRNGATDGTGDADTSADTFTASLSRIGINTSNSEPYNGRMYGWAIYTAQQGSTNVATIQRSLGLLAGLNF